MGSFQDGAGSDGRTRCGRDHERYHAQLREQLTGYATTVKPRGALPKPESWMIRTAHAVKKSNAVSSAAILGPSSCSTN